MNIEVADITDGERTRFIMINLYDIFDEEHKRILEKYDIEIRDGLIDDDEYIQFLKKTNKMSIEDMEKTYDYLDDYFAKEESSTK